MKSFVAIARKRGNSVGVVLPDELGIKAGEKVRLTLLRKTKFAKVSDLFGKLKLGANTARALKQIDHEFEYVPGVEFVK